MKRREFLKTLNTLGLLGMYGSIPGLTLIPSFASAQETGSPKRYFVLIRVPLGWDVTLGLDPKNHATMNSSQEDMFIEYRPDEILNYNRLFLAPACAPLKPHMANIAVVNGVFMSNIDVNHTTNLDYISTGNQMGIAADLPIEMAHASAAGPYGVVFNSYVKRSNRTIMPSRLSDLTDLEHTVDPTQFAGILDGFKNQGELHKAQLNLVAGNPAKQKLIAAINSLREQINSAQSVQQGNLSGAGSTAALVAAAFKSRASFQAMVEFSSNLDTHQGHPGVHMRNQTEVWAAVADMFSLFKTVPHVDAQGKESGSLFDNTTFAVVSEFSRTPALNAAKGKDHNPSTNSVLIAGAGVNGGMTLGESHLITRSNSANGEPRHVAGLIDYRTGEIARTKEQARGGNFQFIFPENIAATLADMVGVDRNRFANVTPDVASLSLIKKA